MKRLWLLLPALLTGSMISCESDDDMPPPKPPGALEEVFTDSVYQLTGVAVSADGRLFTNYPLWSDTYRYALVETQPGNQVVPYPNAEMNNWQPGQSGEDKWVCVQAVYIDGANKMWVVDPASPGMEGVYQQSYKLVKIDIGTGQVERTYEFDGVAGNNSYINDVRVDTASRYAYLTNSNEGGIFVVNLATGNIRQVLQDHYSVRSDPAYTFTVDGRELMKNGQPVKIHSDGIALSPRGEWLYYKPLTDDKLYRIRTEYLQNEDLASADLEAHVEDLGHFTTTDGMIFDEDGNLYLGDIEHYRIVRIDPELQVTTLVEDSLLIWPDSYHISKDGYLYISCSQIQKQPDYNNGVDKRTSPYAIYRLKL
ncbi:L-dopachrome tautomerase-related protein [Chitinophaga japonensis]|uniref:Major royal jelly protein n=1 Tax=Chitinophaga japonensis TaxID=104662 RepID=A0A562SP80_CHIJA|nr:L-dopachrome tautomerase-related protein [Chitinophaga japonensis]TWI82496.1 major royal jelly protein [Chitinophaga japonensis]